MSDVWEWNFGAEALNPTDDTDGDGFDNDEESIGLTNPFINSSVNKPDFISGYGPKVITDGQGNPVEQEFRWYDKKYVRYFVRGYNGFWNTLYSLTGNGGGLHTITLPYNGAFSSHRLYFFEAYDTDDDELNDSEESLFNSSITSTDSDSDGFNDRQEFINGTDPNGADPPFQAHSPNPANGATNVAANVTLSWSNGGAASTYKVYLGTDSTPDSGEYKGQQTGTSYAAGTLASGTTYFWRIDAVGSGGTTSGPVWSFTTYIAPPGPAQSPDPGNGSTGVFITTDISWQNGGGATSYKVYFGTDATPDSGEFRQTQISNGYDPGGLSYNTTYYWRIDSVNAGGTTTGSVWSFTTKLPLPSPAVSPTPAAGATNRSISTNLSWQNGGGATSYKVYFGTDATPDSGEFRQTQSSSSYDPGVLSNDTTYHWRIDSVSAGGTTTGSVWSFTTEMALPGPAVLPTPAEGEAAVSIATNLSWQDGGGASSYDVYFGTSSAPGSGEFQGNQTGLSFSPGTLDYSTTCYWRIDSVNAAGTTAGPVWDFTTEVPPPPVTISFSDFESGWGDWTNITGSDQFDWSRDWGGTPSSGTGPAIDHTLGNSSGYYAYVETSYGSAYNAGNTVILESSPFDADGHQLRLRFYYHMYGANIGTLTVDVFDGAWNLGIWSRSGQQHTGTTTPYTEETVDLSNYTGMLTLRFRVVAAGSYRGDIAVDDISVIEYFDAPNTQPTIVSGAWADESPTQSQVIGLHVTATDAVGGSLNDQGEAGLTYTWQAVTTPVGAPAPTFSADGSNAAKDTSATVSASGIYTFSVTVSDGAAEVASTVQVEVQFVASLPSLSDFEAGWDDWHNVTGDSNADWLRDAAGTPSYGTGPATDNTLGTTQGYYAYVETSSGDGYQSGRTVILESELFEVEAENLVLRFHYHMYGANIGTLYVDFYDGVWTDGIWSRAGQEQGSNAAPYEMGEASIADVQGLVRFRFRYITGGGYRGDVALDDLEVFAFDGLPNVTPWIAAAASASENPTTDPAIELQVLGDDATDASEYNNGETGLVYTWTTVSRPPGAPLPAFPPENGTAQGNQVSITLPLAGEYLFRADVFDGLNSITSDVTVYYSDPVALPSQTDFQLNWGAWSNSASNGSDWRRDSAGTPSSSTGPQLDHTMGTSSGFYAYVETSGGYAYNAGDTVSLVSPVIDASGGDLWLSFFYHMYGSNIGGLNVDVFDGTWQEGVWSISGQQHSSYTPPYAHADVDLAGYSGNIVIRIRGVAAGGYRGDIAVDDIYLGPVSSDLDGDALPDWWEIANFGQADVAASSGDPDTDGLENLAEYFLNTDPNATTLSTATVTVTVLTPLE